MDENDLELDLPSKLGGMFDMSPLTGVLEILMQSLKEQKKVISGLNVTINAMELKTEELEKEAKESQRKTEELEQKAKASQDRLIELEQKANVEPKSIPKPQEDTSQILQSRPGLSEEEIRKIIEEGIVTHFEEYKKTLPDYAAICDNRIQIFFGNSELLKEFSHKIDDAHEVYREFPKVEKLTKEFHERLNQLDADMEPHKKKLDETETSVQTALGLIKEMKKEDILRASAQKKPKTRMSFAGSSEFGQPNESVPEPVPKRETRGVAVANSKRSKGIVKVTADAGQEEEDEKKEPEGEEIPQESDNEETGTWEPPVADEPEEEEEEPFQDEDEEDELDNAEEEIQEKVIEIEPIDAQGMAELAEEVAQVVEDSVIEAMGSRPTSSHDFLMSDDFPLSVSEADLNETEKLLEAPKTQQVKVLKANQRDIQPLEKPRSFQYTRPPQPKPAQEPIVNSQSFSIACDRNRPNSGRVVSACK